MTAGTSDPHPASAEIASLSAAELGRRMEAGELSSGELVEQLLDRVEALDSQLRSMLEIAPDAAELAAAFDAERRAGRVRGRLHGLPVVVKDNIDTASPLHTSGGSLVFGDSSPGRDAPLVSALREAGAVVIGKANLSEWANFRGRPSSSGWSAAGGQTRNPHVLDRTPGGSSSGSASAVAAGLAPLGIGTETDGSIICPASCCGVVALKPTVGLVSRTGIIPISASQDTAGPMARSVEDLALVLEVLARAVDDGTDATATSAGRPAAHETRYPSLLGEGDLSGVRVGVLRDGGYGGHHPPTWRLFETALRALKDTGAELVDPLASPEEPLTLGEDEMIVLSHEFADGIGTYLARRSEQGGPGSQGLPSSLQDLIARVEQTEEERLDLFGIDLLVRSAGTAGLSAESYRGASKRNRDRSRGGLDRLLSEVDVVAVPAMPPAWVIDHVVGDAFTGAGWSPPAVAGYPSATIPIGRLSGLPVALALWGRPFGEAKLLEVMFALERCLGTDVTSPRPGLLPTVSIQT
jgi:amidase